MKQDTPTHRCRHSWDRAPALTRGFDFIRKNAEREDSWSLGEDTDEWHQQAIPAKGAGLVSEVLFLATSLCHSAICADGGVA